MLELQKRHPRYLKFSTIREEMHQPLAVSVGEDGVPAWDPKDTGDGQDFEVVTVTDAQSPVPDKDKGYVLFTSAHAAEFCGRESIPRFFEDLVELADSKPDTMLDGGTGIDGKPLKISVADLLKRDKLIFMDVSPDGWVFGEKNGAPGARLYDQSNGAGVNGNRLAYQDGWIFPDDPVLRANGYSTETQPEGIATTQYLREIRERELKGRPFAASMDWHGPAPVGAMIFHDQGGDPGEARPAPRPRRARQPGRLRRAGAVRDAAGRRAPQAVRRQLRRRAPRGVPGLQPGLRRRRREDALPDAELERVRDGVGAHRLHGLQLVRRLGLEQLRARRGRLLARDAVRGGHRLLEPARPCSSTSTTSARWPRRWPSTPPSATSARSSSSTTSAARSASSTAVSGSPTPTATRRRRPLGVRTPLIGELQQTHYDVSNTDYFRDLRKITPTPIEELSPHGRQEPRASCRRWWSPTTTRRIRRGSPSFARGGRQRGAHRLGAAPAARPHRRPGRQRDASTTPTSATRTSTATIRGPTGLYKRARQMFDPVGLGYPLLMERDQYWPCDASCEESITQNSSPMWTVDRAAWEAAGRRDHRHRRSAGRSQAALRGHRHRQDDHRHAAARQGPAGHLRRPAAPAHRGLPALVRPRRLHDLDPRPAAAAARPDLEAAIMTRAALVLAVAPYRRADPARGVRAGGAARLRRRHAGEALRGSPRRDRSRSARPRSSSSPARSTAR